MKIFGICAASCCLESEPFGGIRHINTAILTLDPTSALRCSAMFTSVGWQGIKLLLAGDAAQCVQAFRDEFSRVIVREGG